LLKPMTPILYALIYLGLGLILFFLTRLFTKNSSSASLITFVGIFILIFFGNYHDAVKSWPVPGFFKTYSFQLSFILLLFILLIYFSVKRKWTFSKLNRFFLAMSAILFVWELVGLGFAYRAYHSKNFDMRIPDRTELRSIPDSATRPNIYFIVFDSYTSSFRLKKDFGFTNTIDSFLIGKGFYIASHSRSNYPSTALSVASTFNMNYLSTDFKGENQFSKMLKEGYTVAHSDLPILLKKWGYEFVNCSIFDFKDQPAINGRLFSNLAERSLIEPTLIGRIWRDIAWQFLKLDKTVERVTGKYKQQFIFSNIQTCTTSIQKKGIPRFVYCHVMLPHHPFLFTADGKPRRYNKTIPTRDLYLDQLVYTNTIIRSLISGIMKNESHQAVIILEGDHGFRDYITHDDPLKEFDNLNAYFFPDKKYELLYDSTSPVNSFRVVFNKYFGQSLPMLPDSSIKVVDPGVGQGLWPF